MDMDNDIKEVQRLLAVIADRLTRIHWYVEVSCAVGFGSLLAVVICTLLYAIR